MALRFRNTLLNKKPSRFKEQVLAGDVELAHLSHNITKKRVEFLEALEPLLGETFQALFSEKHNLKINLDSRIIGISKWRSLECE